MRNLRKRLSVLLSIILVTSVLISCGMASDDTRQVEAAKEMKTEKAHVTVHPNKTVGTMHKELFGMHVPAWNETVIQNGVVQSRLLQNAKTAGLGLLVYPGGNYGYDFVWNDPNLPTEMTTDQFLELSGKLGAATKISVNPNESPELAADWVEYVNDEKKANVEYWEVADEPYLTMSVDAFIEKMKAFVPKMKEADPSIKIVANVSMANPDYTKRVIAEVGNLIDVYSIHFFPLPPSQKFSPDSPYTEEEKEKFFADLLQTPTQVRDQLKTLRAWVKEAYPEKKVEYHIGSYTTVWWGPEDWTVNSLPAGLWTADVLGTFAEEQVDVAAYWALMNPFPPGQGDFGMFSPEMKPYVGYYPFELYNEHFGDVLVETKSNVEKDLSTYASVSKDGKNMYVMLINKSPDKDLEVDLNLGKFKPRGDAAAWILDGPAVADHVYDYGLRKEYADKAGRKISWTVPSYSVVALEIPGVGSKLDLSEAPNLALNKRAAASSEALKSNAEYYDTYDFVADKAIDGDLQTRWAAKIFEKEDEWFRVDLGQTQPFNRIKMSWEYWATEYVIEVSDDGENWRQVADQSDAKRLEEPPQPVEEITLDEPVDARYVRISMTGRPDQSGAKAGTSQWTPDAFSLWEVGVYLK